MSTYIYTVWHYNTDSPHRQPENNELPHKKPSVMAISGQNHGGVGKLGITEQLVGLFDEDSNRKLAPIAGNT